METYSVELAASLSEHFDVRRWVLDGNEDGSPPGLLRYAWFLASAMAFCLWRGRGFDRVVFTDLILFPAAVCHWLVAPAPGGWSWCTGWTSSTSGARVR